MGKFYQSAFPQSGIAQSVRIIRNAYHFTDEYILSKPQEWRNRCVADILDNDAREKEWDVNLTALIHTPMTKEAGTGYKRNVKEIKRSLERLTDLAKQLVSPSRPRSKDEPIVSSHKVVYEPGDYGDDLLKDL